MWQTTKLVAVAATASVLYLLAAGCSAGAGPGSGSTDSSSVRPAETTPPGNGGYQLLERRSALDDLQPVRWNDWEQLAPTTIRVYLSAGPRDCYAVTATIEEADATVTIDLEVGAIPNSGDCTADMKASAVDIPLVRELGDRTVTQSSR